MKKQKTIQLKPRGLTRLASVLMLCFALLSAGSAFAVQYTVVPTGGTAGNTNGTGADPVCRYFNSIRYQVVYTAAELTASGMPGGTQINALAWNVTQSSVSLGNYTIKMGHTAATNSAAHNVDATTTVKNAFTYTVTAGFNDIVFDVPFIWDGASNVVVEICTGAANPFTSPYGGVQAKTGVTSGSRHYRVDGISACGTNTGTANTTKPYVRFDGSAPPPCSGTPAAGTAALSVASGCPGAPITMSATGLTTGSGISYQWYSSTDGFVTPVLIPGATGASYTVTTGVAVSTGFRLTTTCSTGPTTNVSNIVNYTVVGAATWPEAFSGGVVPPGCWTTDNPTYCLYSAASAFGAGVGSCNINFYNAGGGTLINLISPPFTALVSPNQLTFDQAYRTYATENDQLNVQTSTNGGLTWTTLQNYTGGVAGTMVTAAPITSNWTPAAGEWATKTLTVPAGVNRIRFNGVSAFGNNLFLDNINLTAPPTCGIPTGLNASLNSATSVDLSWVAPGVGTVSDYEYALTFSAIPPGSGTPNVGTSVLGAPVLANNNYYLHVRTNCTGPVSTSSWATYGPFFTGYCAVSSTSTSEYINSFVTTGGVTNINSVTNASGAFGYSDFSAQSVSAAAGTSFNFTLTQNAQFEALRIWVDWNNNLTFESGEEEFVNLAVFPTPTTYTGAISIPALQPVGNYRMRVRNVDLDWDGLLNVPACGVVSYGECEDYTVTVVTPPTCYPVTGLAITSLTPTDVSFSWTGPVLGNPAVQYYYEVSTSATPPVLGTNNGLLTTAGPIAHVPNSQNYIHVRTDCDGLGTDYSSWVTLPFFSGYCQPTATTNNSTYITNFNTTGGIANIANTSTFSTSPSGYEDFTAQSCSHYPGQTVGVNFTMTGGTAGVNIWVDWNNDLDFNDAGEFEVGSGGFLPTGTYGSVITVDNLQAIGNYRMRIRTDWLSGNPNSCGNITRGEAEDYVFSVIPLPACGAVLGSFASTYVTSTDLPLVCTGQTVNFAVSPAAPLASGITYRLQYCPTIAGVYNTVAGPDPSPDFSLLSPASGFYRIQVLCSGTPIAATWTPVAVSISNPTVTTTTPASRCGNGTVTLNATGSPALATLVWYDQLIGGIPVGSGTSFTTPSLSSTTNYYVQAENVVPTANIGAGTNPSNAMVETPFSCLYESSRNWYIIRKSELQAAGLVASTLTSLGVTVTGAPAVSMLDYTIKMAHTSAVNLNSGYTTVNSGFTTVFGPTNVTPPAIGVKTFTLNGAFDWNGTDNIIIEICHSNDPTAVLDFPVSWGTAGTVETTDYTFYCSYGHFDDNVDMCPLTASPNAFPPAPVLINTRPNFIIGGQISACNSPRVQVIATVNPAPQLTTPAGGLFAPSVGNFIPIPQTASSSTPLATVELTPPFGIYNDALTSSVYNLGDNADGITEYFAPLSTTTYTATATAAGCTTTGMFTITVDPSGIPNSACGAPTVTVTNAMNFVQYNTLGAVVGLGNPCGPLGNEAWLKFIVPASGEVHVATFRSGASLTDITENNVGIFYNPLQTGCTPTPNNVACSSTGYKGGYAYVSYSGMTPGHEAYIRLAGLLSAAVPNGKILMAVTSHLIWTPTNGDDVALPENWEGGDIASTTTPSATRSIWVPAGTTTPKMYANTTVRGVNLQGAAPYFVSNGINLNSFTLNVKGNWNVGPVGSASTVLNCNGLVEFNASGATAVNQVITGKTTFGNLNTNNTSTGGTVQANAATGVSCILTPVAGTFNANGNLIMKSSTANSAGLVAPSAGTITGSASVERKIGGTSGYHYLSSAVSGATVNNTSTGWRDDFTILASLDGQVFIPGGIYSQLATVFEYDETNANPNPDYGWIGATGAADNITPLKGFACVVPANVTVDVLGPLNNNIIPGGYTITRQSDGLNVVGNPYASPISWNAFRGLASNTAALSTSGYKAFITSGGYAGSYGTWNGSIGSPVQVTDRIASSQAFMVECLQPSATINALNTIRLTTPADVTATFFSGYNSVPDMIRMEVQGNGHAAEMVVYFDASSVDAYNNNFDSKAVFAPVAGVPTIYSVVENNNVAINVMGKLNLDKVVPLGVKIQTAGTYNLVATDMASFAPSVVAYLEDTQAGTITNLRTNPSYSVTLPVGEINNRFLLHFHPAVELNALNETCAGNDGKLLINYPTTNTVNIVIKDANGNVVSTQNNVSGAVAINNLVAGNYVAEMTFGIAPNVYTTSDYFTVAGGNAVFANLSASANTVDMASNTTVNFTATAQGASSFNWNFGDGTVITNGPANISHTFAQAGTYNVTFEASNGVCNTVATTTVEVTNATGLTAIANSNLQVIGAGSKVTVRFGNNFEGTGNIEVINMLGEVVAHLDNVSMKGTREIEMSSIAAGQYMVKITNNNKLFTEKVYLSRQ